VVDEANGKKPAGEVEVQPGVHQSDQATPLERLQKLADKEKELRNKFEEIKSRRKHAQAYIQEAPASSEPAPAEEKLVAAAPSEWSGEEEQQVHDDADHPELANELLESKATDEEEDDDLPESAEEELEEVQNARPRLIPKILTKDEKATEAKLKSKTEP